MNPVKGLQYELRRSKPYLMLHIIIIPRMFGLGHKSHLDFRLYREQFLSFENLCLYIPSRKFLKNISGHVITTVKDL
jgi:hypothetical protein